MVDLCLSLCNGIDITKRRQWDGHSLLSLAEDSGVYLSLQHAEDSEVEDG